MITHFNHENHVKNMPDAFKKGADSNNKKILEIESGTVTELRENLAAINESLDIEQATGATLDLYGEMYDCQRGGRTDEQYRKAILLQIAQNRTECDATSIINALVAALGVPAEVFDIDDSETSGNIDINVFPYDKLQEAGISVTQVYKILLDLIAAGVGIKVMNVSHEVEETPLFVAAVATHEVEYTLETEAVFYETVDAPLYPVAVVTHTVNYIMEV